MFGLTAGWWVKLGLLCGLQGLRVPLFICIVPTVKYVYVSVSAVCACKALALTEVVMAGFRRRCRLQLWVSGGGFMVVVGLVWAADVP